MELPDWPEGTVTILSTGGGTPHAIPVSAVVRAGGDRVLLGLAARRASLERLREFPTACLTVLAAGDVAVSLHGRAVVVADPVAGTKLAAVELRIEHVQDHNAPTYVIEDGVRWRWTDDAAAERDAQTRAALHALAAERGGEH